MKRNFDNSPRSLENLLNTEVDVASTQEIHRRDFLKLTGLTAAGLLIGINHAKANNLNTLAEKAFEPNVFLSIQSDGRIILYSKNPEIGQGIKTALPQLLAEELEVDWKSIEVRQGILDARFGSQFAGGSTGVKTNFLSVRNAGASAREMLVEAAARKWQTSLDNCYAKEGAVYNKVTSEKFSYAQLAEAASKLNVRENPTLKAANAESTLTIPMRPETRSLNLATSVGIVLYEAVRQRESLNVGR